MTPEETRARLLYRDHLILVIDKPAGVAVHRGPKGGRSLEDEFDALRFGLPRKPALAHRLDRETSGCLVLGRRPEALVRLGRLFKHGEIAKIYWAIVKGGPDEPEGLVDLPLGRRDATRGWWMKVDASGATAQTRWRILGRGQQGGEALAWLELRPLTGRTHQLRVHAAAMGWPVLGEAIYDRSASASRPPLHLHARRIEIPLVKAEPPIVVEAAAPAHMAAALGACGFSGEPGPSAPRRGVDGAPSASETVDPTQSLVRRR